MDEIWAVNSHKNTKIVATRCQILRLNAPKSISAGAAPHTPLRELTALPEPLAGIKGTYTTKRRARCRKGKRGGKGREGKAGGGEGRTDGVEERVREGRGPRVYL